MNVTIQEAYDEACRLLGESAVRESLIRKHAEQEQAEQPAE